MFCPKCGKELPDDVAFCSSCGTRVNDSEQPNPPQTAPINTFCLISLVLSVLIFLSIAFAHRYLVFLAPLALFLTIVGLRQVSKKAQRGRTLGLIAIVFCILDFVFFLYLVYALYGALYGWRLFR